MLYIVLLHYPVYNKEGRVVTTAIANMDIHDIARIAKTYGADGFYIVNPVAEQRKLAAEIIRHWREGYGAHYNPSRQKAFELIQVRESLEDVAAYIRENTGMRPRVIVTGANVSGDVLTFAELRKMLKHNHDSYLLVFGTGSGIADEVMDRSDFKLESIKGRQRYNHLSVRSAVAVVMDRILGDERCF